MPEFLAPLENHTVIQGRDVSFTCVVNHLQSYRVRLIDFGSFSLAPFCQCVCVCECVGEGPLAHCFPKPGVKKKEPHEELSKKLTRNYLSR